MSVRPSNINWRPWGAEAFAEAAASDKPILLNLTAVWCQWCHLMDDTTYAEPAVIDLINEKLADGRRGAAERRSGLQLRASRMAAQWSGVAWCQTQNENAFHLAVVSGG